MAAIVYVDAENFHMQKHAKPSVENVTVENVTNCLFPAHGQEVLVYMCVQSDIFAALHQVYHPNPPNRKGRKFNQQTFPLYSATCKGPATQYMYMYTYIQLGTVPGQASPGAGQCSEKSRACVSCYGCPT